jgi:hypothetical protein
MVCCARWIDFGQGDFCAPAHFRSRVLQGFAQGRNGGGGWGTYLAKEGADSCAIARLAVCKRVD